ncbi:unnamed protein product [Effrenium voratum]|nr:unnamed protein product [Effrenium voratum]
MPVLVLERNKPEPMRFLQEPLLNASASSSTLGEAPTQSFKTEPICMGSDTPHAGDTERDNEYEAG